jgi:type I restriction enzyme R subunit
MTELEWQTRRDRINTKLGGLSSPWQIQRFHEGLDLGRLTHHAIEEFPTANGPADYALLVNGRLLGLIEAKKVSVGPENVLEQAKRYSMGADDTLGVWDGYKVPFLISTNGEKIQFLDIRDWRNLPRELSAFPTPQALEERLGRPAVPLQESPNIDIERLRPYQREAIDAVESAIATGKRNMLVAMATGTGKTFLTVSQIYRLLRSGAFKRILFLVDRRALAAQAVREFNSFDTPRGSKFNQEYQVFSQRFHREDFDEDEKFDPEVLPNSYLTDPKPSHTFVYVSTIQRMTINLFGWRPGEKDERDGDDDAQKMSIPIHAFDLIIADECHRGYTSGETAIWRDVIEYFDAVRIGLTATPAPNSLSLFKEIVYRYTTTQAVEDGYLVDYDAIKVRSEVLIQGAFLKEGEHVGLVDRETGEEKYDELEEERQFGAEEVEHKITSPDTNQKIIKEIARHAFEFEIEHGRFPKTLIFAVNDIPHVSHADQVVAICKEVFGRGDNFVQKITGSPSVDRPLQKIREFRNRPQPSVVVTVDMLSTGVDIPCLEYIVFMRPVKSRILWVQMLGRGTRRCEDIKKEKFTIFDCFDGSLIEYFRNATDFHIDPPDKPIIPLAVIIENIYQNKDRSYNTKILVKRLRRIERTMSGNAREEFKNWIPEGDIGKFADHLPNKIDQDFTETMKLLRNPEFQFLLLNYERAKVQFWKGYDVQDEVTSEVLFRKGSDYLKPADYLDLFTRFVKDNPEHIEAIGILLERPKDWNTNVLNDLRTKLGQNAFREEDLRKAHRVVYSKALADIISMVKHAAREQEPVLNADERVDLALAKLRSGHAFTEEQEKWLGYIRNHLIENLTIDFDDFDSLPVFDQRGGSSAAKKVFGSVLPDLLKEINRLVAA